MSYRAVVDDSWFCLICKKVGKIIHFCMSIFLCWHNVSSLLERLHGINHILSENRFLEHTLAQAHDSLSCEIVIVWQRRNLFFEGHGHFVLVVDYFKFTVNKFLRLSVVDGKLNDVIICPEETNRFLQVTNVLSSIKSI